MTTTATVGVAFSAGSVAKRILLFAINFFVLVIIIFALLLAMHQIDEQFLLLKGAGHDLRHPVPLPSQIDAGILRPDCGSSGRGQFDSRAAINNNIDDP